MPLTPDIPKQNNDADNADRLEEVRRALKPVLPAMEADGGGLIVHRVEGDDVYVEFRGTCLDCPSISLTIQQGVEPTLRRELPWFGRLVRLESDEQASAYTRQTSSGPVVGSDRLPVSRNE